MLVTVGPSLHFWRTRDFPTLGALANKHRKIASTVKRSPATVVQSFALMAERYQF